jgi:hypothetical protein
VQHREVRNNELNIILRNNRDPIPRRSTELNQPRAKPRDETIELSVRHPPPFGTNKRSCVRRAGSSSKQ